MACKCNQVSWTESDKPPSVHEFAPGFSRSDLTEAKVREIIREELAAFHPAPASPGYMARTVQRWLA